MHASKNKRPKKIQRVIPGRGRGTATSQRDEVPLHIYIPEEGLAMEEGHIQACQRLGTGAMHRARGGEIQSKEEKTPGPQISRLFKTR